MLCYPLHIALTVPIFNRKMSYDTAERIKSMCAVISKAGMMMNRFCTG